jgi:hypothetical protein
MWQNKKILFSLLFDASAATLLEVAADPKHLGADLDAVVRDPSHPTQLLPAYDSGDHLHPNNAGCRAEGQAIPLALFQSH